MASPSTTKSVVEAGRNDGADARGRFLHDRLRPDHMQQVATLQHDVRARSGFPAPPRVSDRRYRPRVQSCSDASARVRPAIFGFVSITSATETGTSRSSLSSISSPRDPTRSTMTCRGPEIAITSPAWSTRPGSASTIRPPRRSLWMNSRCSAAPCLGGGNRRSRQRGSLGQSIGAQLELSPGRGQARLGAAHSQGLLELCCLLFQVDLQERWRDRCQKQDHAGVRRRCM